MSMDDTSLPDSASSPSDDARPLFRSLWRGAARRCPSCGRGRLLASFTKIAPSCTVCGEALRHHRADDAPPYFTILIVGHVVVPLLVLVEDFFFPPLWVHWLLWLPLTLGLALFLLPRVKGAIVGWQWALRMHGFGGDFS
ncbi:MAG: DUF983 domain-containing protein [Alphaproteobacteria bacterium]|nr:DUF983 domain-containing protein [Alphaproteobacteria bacterium]